MRRTLAGIAIGIGIALLTMIVAETIGNRLFGIALAPDQAMPVPDTALSLGVQASIVAGWFLGTLFGAAAAVLISRRRSAGWWVAAAILVGILARLAFSATPPLMIGGGIAGPLFAALIAQLSGKLLRPRAA